MGRAENLAGIDLLKSLENRFLDSKCLILSGGPSLSDLDIEELDRLPEDIIVIAVKQAYYKCPGLINVHLINDDNYEVYNYELSNPKPLIIKISSASKFRPTPNSREDIKFNILKESSNHEKSLVATRDFCSGLIDSATLERPWGPGIMYEIGIYFPIFLGIKDIYIAGWDLGSPHSNVIKRFYEKRGIFQSLKNICAKESPFIYNKVFNRIENLVRLFLYIFNKEIVLNIPGVTINEADLISNSTEYLYEWVKHQGVSFFIVSDKSMVSNKFQRVKLNDIHI